MGTIKVAIGREGDNVLFSLCDHNVPPLILNIRLLEILDSRMEGYP